MSGFDVDVDAVVSQAGHFPELADRVKAIHRTLSDALDAEGTCWGEDTVGQSFAAGYTGPADETLEAVGALHGRLSDVGQRLHDTATSYRGTDQGNVHVVDAAAES
jgi:uncharacterized protein YukE